MTGYYSAKREHHFTYPCIYRVISPLRRDAIVFLIMFVFAASQQDSKYVNYISIFYGLLRFVKSVVKKTSSLALLNEFKANTIHE